MSGHVSISLFAKNNHVTYFCGSNEARGIQFFSHPSSCINDSESRWAHRLIHGISILFKKKHIQTQQNGCKMRHGDCNKRKEWAHKLRI